VEYGRITNVAKPVSRIVQGTIMLREDDKDAGFRLMDDVLAAGITSFDTGRTYGRNEELFGEWVATRGVRNQVMVLGKGAHPSGGKDRRVNGPDIQDDIDTSLRAFGFDQIDLYILHRDNEETPVGEIVEVLDRNYRAGKIGGYGGSNWRYERIREANEFAAANGLTPFVASSPNLSLAVWKQPPWAGCVSIAGPEGAEARAWYAQSGIAVLPWSSLAGGFMTGRFRRDNLDTFTDYFDTNPISAYATEDNFRKVDRLEELANQRGSTIPRVALAYVLDQPMNIFPLAAPRDAAQIADNAEALSLKLSPEEIAWLELRTDERPF
jgi:aryl-alcohol dehydrogenase-like predicted oxidoreductase